MTPLTKSPIILTGKKMKFFKSILLSGSIPCSHQTPAVEDDPELDHECTSWLVMRDLTGNNTNILHKNRDAHARDITLYLSPVDSPRKWIASGNGGSTTMGLNASGLAGVMNSGEKCLNPPDIKEKKGTPAILQTILESCDTAAQGVAKLKELHSMGDYSHGDKGSTFFLLDCNEGYICEMTAKDITVQHYTSGYAVRANIWQNPGMQRFSRNSIKLYLDSSARAFIARSGLNEALDKQGKITLTDIFALSRHCQMPEESSEKRSVCFKKTNSSASLEIDRQYPDVLSTGYFTIGHPRHTIYVPVPVCAEKLHPAMVDLKWSSAAWQRFDKLGLEAPIPENRQAFEKESLARYGKAKEEARQLLIQGKRAEAVKLLNTAASDIWNSAADILL